MNIIFLIKPKCDTAYLYTDDSVRQGLEKMYYHKYTAIPVIDHDGIYCGTITEGDFLWNVLGKNPVNAALQQDIRSLEHQSVSMIETCLWELLPEKMSSDTLQKYDFL